MKQARKIRVDKPKISIETFGCSANKSDSEIMAGILKKEGYELSDKADLVLVNTCGVKRPTEDKIIHRLKKLSSENKKIIVAGCLTKINLGGIKKAVPNFSAIMDTKSVHKIAEVAGRVDSGESRIVEFSDSLPSKPLLPMQRFNETISIIQISEGCKSSCTFCGTKLARGDIKSYRPELIRERVRADLEQGVKEFWITSQDGSAYGQDIGTNLAELLKSVCSIEGGFMIRVGMMNPLHFLGGRMLKDLIEAFKSEKIFKFLHLCVQSGSDKVLKDMRRGYKAEDFERIVKAFRKEIPEITISTDIIVGFPTESEKGFSATKSLVERIKPDIVNISKYGARLGTLASKMEPLDPKAINERSASLHFLVKGIQQKKNEKWLGWEGKIIIDERGKEGSFMGRNYSYKPVVVKARDDFYGKVLNVKIKSAKSNFLLGSIVG